MAKSKSGGTRSYIRGRVGADVYSIGKDAKGKKQQVVRSLAESVANPQTLAQMRGRMYMSTVMQVVAVLKPIIDHSFDNVSGRQPNISEFISRNYALVKADAIANPAGSNEFGLNQFGEKGAKRGHYVISDGKAVVPTALSVAKATGIVSITLPADNVTVGGLKAVLGLSSEEYFTLVGLTAAGAANYERFRINSSLGDTEAINSALLPTLFATEGNAAATVAIASNVISITLSAVAGCCDVIISRKTDEGFIHSKAVLGGLSGYDWNANAALPTYPVGNNAFLNGGDMLGMSETNNDGGGSSQSVNAPTISGETPFANTTSVTMGAQAGAEIHYTTDGSAPNSSSALYSSAITLSATTTIKAIAILNGVSSSVATKTFTKSEEDLGDGD